MFVFPAFDKNYKHRKRNHICCRECRAKRTRCRILNSDYEMLGCDNCRERGVPCTLQKKRTKQDNILRGLASFKVEPPSIENDVSFPATVPVNDGIRPATPLSTEKVHFKTEEHETKAVQHVMAFENPHKPPSSDFPDFPPTARTLLEHRSSTGDLWHRTPPQVPVVPQEPYVPSIESIDGIIERIDWRYLKRHFNFNVKVQGKRFFFGKIPSRKVDKALQVNLEIMLKQHFTKTKKLKADNALHFKFLLAMHAFTLNTPGFCVISEADLVKLFEVYFYKVNSVFPVVFEREFWEQYKHDSIPSVVMYAVVLVAARDLLAQPILKRSFVDQLLPFEKQLVRFLSDLDMKIRQLLIFLPEIGDTEKLGRLVTNLLLTLSFKHNQFGNEQSSHDLADAVSCAYSLLIHHEFFHVRLVKEHALQKSAYLKHLWWVIFIFDRYNAVLNGKATFIKRGDFNIQIPQDKPHLKKLVLLAYALEDTLMTVFRPPRTGPGTPVELDTLDGDPKFDAEKIVADEEALQRDKEWIKNTFEEYRNFDSGNEWLLSAVPVAKYRDRKVEFLERLIRSQIVLTLRTGQIKFSDDSHNLEGFGIELSDLIMSIIKIFKDGRGHEMMMNIPIVPLMILVAFSIPLSARIRIVSKVKTEGHQSLKFSEIAHVGELSVAYLDELEAFAPSWWFVNEVVKSIEKLNHRMASDLDGEQPAPKKPTRSRKGLATVAGGGGDDLETTDLPPNLSVTSPGFYDEVIKKEVSDFDEEDDEDDISEDLSGAQQIAPQSERMLVPPIMLHAFEKKEDDKSEHSFAGPWNDIFFDVGQFAELITETGLLPHLDIFSDDPQYSYPFS